MRQITAEGMMEKRMRWGDENARAPIRRSRMDSLKEFLKRLIGG
jgi:hypothetical protein